MTQRPRCSNAMRVLYLEAGSGSGGSSASLVRLVTHLDPQRVTPFVLVNQRGSFIQQLELLGIPVDELGFRGHGQPLAEQEWKAAPSRLWQNLVGLHGPIFRQVRRRIRHVRAQLLHLNNSPRVALAALAAARSCRVPVVCHLRVARPLDRIELIAMRWIDRLIVTSHTSRAICLAQGVAPNRVVQIFNGLDVAGFRNGFDRAGARKQFGFAEGELVIGVMSRLLPGKGHEVFFQALSRIVGRRPEVRAVIAGDACEGASDYPQQLRRLVGQLGLTNRVRFTGWISQPAALYPACDLIAQTSLLPEGFSLTCLEAMAYGIPVVSTRVGATSEVVEDGVTGRLVPPDDPSAMADAIIGLLAEPARMRRMGQAGYQRAVARFDIRKTASAIEAVYRAVVK